MESRIPRCSYCLVFLPKVIYMDTMKPNFNREITPEENTSCSINVSDSWQVLQVKYRVFDCFTTPSLMQCNCKQSRYNSKCIKFQQSSGLLCSHVDQHEPFLDKVDSTLYGNIVTVPPVLSYHRCVIFPIFIIILSVYSYLITDNYNYLYSVFRGKKPFNSVVSIIDYQLVFKAYK